ncbi:hypothetical protein Dimus_030867 [Dionaea muscipula]
MELCGGDGSGGLWLLAVPAAVSVPKSMASEGFSRARVGVSSTQGGESDCVSPEMEKCSSLLSYKGPINGSEPSSYIKKTDTGLCKSSSHHPRLPKEDVPQELNHGHASNRVSLIAGFEEKQLQGKAGKSPRNVNGCSRRPRLLQVENQMPQAEFSDMSAASDKLGSILLKCSNAEKTQITRTKSNLNSKRGDRRSSRGDLVKAKCDSGAVSSNLASGGSNVLGMYGLKHDVHNVTQLLGDISLNELLDRNYRCHIYGEEKGKKTTSMRDNILDSVRKAFSILRVRGPGQRQQPEDASVDLDKKPSLLSTPSSSVANGTEPEAENHQPPDLSSGDIVQESSIKVEVLADSTDFPFQPIDILEHLVLSAPKDLESLLQDATKLAAPSRCSDPRSAKTTSLRISLPQFPWSHGYNGHCKSNADASKFACKSVCQGRWVRIANTSSFFGGGTDRLADLGSLSYDPSLVPLRQVKYSIPEMGSTSSLPSLPGVEQASSSGICQTASFSPHDSGTSNCKVDALHSPRLLTAAQTLCDIASCSSSQDPNGITKWPKQPSEKAMKARKFKSSEKHEDLSMPKSATASNDVVGIMGHTSSFKKPKLPVIEKKEDSSYMNSIRVSNYWPAPRSSRSSPTRFARDAIAEARHSNGNFVRQSLLIPPPPRVLDKSSHGQQKPRKVVPMDWSWTKG